MIDLQFIIHRGSHQIGGNCVELVSPNARILIDCGRKKCTFVSKFRKE